jgi:pyruvate kinase
MPVAAAVTYTSSGCTGLRAARERPAAPIVGMATGAGTARRLALVWGVHAVRVREVHDVSEMRSRAREVAVAEEFARQGDVVAITAGTPFGASGTTNLLNIVRV